MASTSINLGKVFEIACVGGILGIITTGIYGLSSTYARENGELNIIIEGGAIQRIDARDVGVGAAWGWKESIFELPGSQISLEFNDTELRLISLEGERFSGPIKMRYQYVFEEGDGVNEEYLDEYQNLFDRFGDLPKWRASNSHYENSEGVEPFIVERFQGVLKEVFSEVPSAEFYNKADEIRFNIIEQLNASFIVDGLPFKITELDLESVEISPLAEQRISGLLSNAITEDDDANMNPTTTQPVSVVEFTQNVSEFYSVMRAENFEDSEITELFCIYASENASRQGRALNMDCLRDGKGDTAIPLTQDLVAE